MKIRFLDSGGHGEVKKGPFGSDPLLSFFSFSLFHHVYPLMFPP